MVMHATVLMDLGTLNGLMQFGSGLLYVVVGWSGFLPQKTLYSHSLWEQMAGRGFHIAYTVTEKKIRAIQFSPVPVL